MAEAAKKNDLLFLPHLLGIFTGFLGPLIVLLVTEDKSLKNHAKAALNWQFSSLIYYIVSGILMLILIGFVLALVISILNIIFCIIAAVKASDGELWNYTLSIPFFKL